ncbi:peptidoglycan editing factor PgeF [Oecophyllibacter saccharovorans]|uniref:peptidoglycan editing factor PgeF n=1 Tax=Oecophyllibacter saccharovorans TaxID=2558360 RepID=UPI00117440A0|nr:peptidoglycan editing factor PgeF [Oecophyllibacter saccharovorans]TPW33763.1 peptidoglycan editing factor PgeF [Oecophyllibacter saccharovorans]
MSQGQNTSSQRQSVTPLRVGLLEVPHGFFTREGGVSPAPCATLNGGINTVDAPRNVEENRRRIADYLDVTPQNMPALRQVHGNRVIVIGQDAGPRPVAEGAPPEADAVISVNPDFAASVATADCAPVLLMAGDGKIVAAAHAGWRGAVGGILEATVRRMEAMGARHIRAVVGPCIGANSYEIGADMRNTVLQSLPEGERAEAENYFHPSFRENHARFDLAGFCLWRLRLLGVTQVENMDVDTLTDPRFFSYRRATLEGNGETGRQLSVIRPH